MLTLTGSGVTVAQTPRVWRLGILVGRGRSDPPAAGVVQAMRDLGYVEGQNLVVESRFADGDYRRLPELAAELVQLKPDVIVTPDGTAVSLAAQRATSTIPIVFAYVSDPVASGLVMSLAKPGGNVTGVAGLAPIVDAKQLEMLASFVRGLDRVFFLSNPSNPSTRLEMEKILAAGQRLGISITLLPVTTVEDIEAAFTRMRKERPGAVIVGGDTVLVQQRQRIADFCIALRLPSSQMVSSYPEAGGLLSYGGDLSYMYARAAAYVDKIFHGAKVGDLPVDQPMKFYLVINKKTAKTLGLEIPPDLLVQADKVIE
jgi:putative ABC transport system substrate-binding protein